MCKRWKTLLSLTEIGKCGKGASFSGKKRSLDFTEVNLLIHSSSILHNNFDFPNEFYSLSQGKAKI